MPFLGLLRMYEPVVRCERRYAARTLSDVGGCRPLLDRVVAPAVTSERRETGDEEQREEQANAPNHHENCPDDLDIKALQRGFHGPDKDCAHGDKDEAEADATGSHSNQLSFRSFCATETQEPFSRWPWEAKAVVGS